MYRRFFKRSIDLLGATGLLVLTLPLTLAVTMLLAVANRGRIFFVQPRPGKDGRIFRIIKFKTMNDRRDGTGQLLPDALRLTPVGRWVRRTSLDELPQLLNVVRGDLSLIGPRPLLVEYLPLYSAAQARRHAVRPGITGWAQVNGRNALSWEQKFAFDVYYVDHLSFALDVKIALRTVSKVIRGEGIASEGSATMERFTGNSPHASGPL